MARLVDAEPLLSPALLRLAQWMSDYYLCPLGQVVQAIVPAGVRGQAGHQDLDSHGTIQAGISSAEDLTHTSGSEGRHDFVGAEPHAGRESHCRRLY